MTAEELRKLSVVELNQEIISLTRELLNLRLRKSTESVKRSHLASQVRRNIARAKTIIAEMQKAGVS